MTTFADLGLVAQLRVCASVIAGTATSFRNLGRDGIADHLVDFATWASDVATDLEHLLEDEP
jgi:hypothetical protein